MRFADMLLGNYKVPKVKAGTRNVTTNDTTKPVDLRREETVRRYREVMGDEWVATREIEYRLGYSRSTSLKLLKEWEGCGWVDKRPVGGKGYQRHIGFEWRWK